jgi:crotonobetainyl-CoA:carnitine CoA-transferase CaiB-like acyl-CoA transferase
MAGVLEGVRVIDFGQYIAGPLAAMLLGDQGADVVRIDPPAAHAGTRRPMRPGTATSAASCSISSATPTGKRRAH